jgi:hypothetical protein
VPAQYQPPPIPLQDQITNSFKSMPTGPPAMKLITMIEVSDASEEDEHKIAKLLTVNLPTHTPCGPNF